MKTRTKPVTSLLNKIAAEIAKTSPDSSELEIKHASLSCLLGMLVKGGMNGRDAFDTVFGEGAYNKLAGNVYDAIRAAA